jgi:large subunit ribosomal protein L31e
MVDEIERVYTVSLVSVLRSSRREKAQSAVKFLKSFLARHMKTDGSRVKLSAELNSSIWMKGMQKPPRNIRIKAKRDAKGEVQATLQEIKEEKR